jgi:hypothetical protein
MQVYGGQGHALYIVTTSLVRGKFLREIDGWTNVTVLDLDFAAPRPAYPRALNKISINPRSASENCNTGYRQLVRTVTRGTVS